MNITLQQPLASFDLETTGTLIAKDRIVEIAIVKLFPNGTKETYHKRVNPEMPIPLETSEIHGIYDVDVLDAPKLQDIGGEIISFLDNCDLTGYNCNKFDIPFLIEELDRVGMDFSIEGRNIIDVQNIFHKMEQRTLTAAYKFYCKKELVNAHSALADSEATLEILLAQVDYYDEIENNAKFLGEFSTYGTKTMDFARRIGFNKEEVPVFNFGKHKGTPVVDVFKREPGYYAWIMKGDFTKDTKNKFTSIWTELKK
ncbi:MAG: DNA polymerase-3 subunit epsilon [Flavobacteriales bacterium]|jgi:DNA polymerase-3 subunit epsilon